MTKRELALALHGVTTKLNMRARIRDDDLRALAEGYPELAPVFEELQAWREQ